MESEGVKGGKNYHFWLNGRTEFCQIFMTLRNVFVKQAIALKSRVDKISSAAFGR
jgi:hypothetical protein